MGSLIRCLCAFFPSPLTSQETGEPNCCPSPPASTSDSQAFSREYLQDHHLDDSRGEAPSQTLSKLPIQTCWPPRISRKARMHFRGLADHPPVPSQEQARAAGRQGQVSYPHRLLWGGGRQNLEQPPPLLPRLGTAGTSVWSLEAPRSNLMLGKHSHQALRLWLPREAVLPASRAGVQGHPTHPMAQGLPLLATGPGLRGTKAARA